MAEHEVDTVELEALARALDAFAEFVASFDSRTVAHGNALLGAWSGRASREFMGEVALWSLGAKALLAKAENMTAWAQTAKDLYTSASDQAKEVVGA